MKKYTYSYKGHLFSNYPDKWKHELEDLKGEKFGELTVLHFDSTDKWGRSKWLCQCSCGKQKIISAHALKSGAVISCGHINREKAKQRMIEINRKKGRLGVSKNDWYVNYACMLRRVLHPKEHNYEEIFAKMNKDEIIEPKWLNNPYAFYHEIGPKPGKNYTIDRIDTTKGYIKGNVRWADKETQAINKWKKQINVLVPIKGISKTKKGANRSKRSFYISSIRINGKNYSYKTPNFQEAIKIRYLLEKKYRVTHYGNILKYRDSLWDEYDDQEIDNFLDQITQRSQERILSTQNPLRMVNEFGTTIFFNSRKQAERYFHRTVHTRNIDSGRRVKQGYFKGWLFMSKYPNKHLKKHVMSHKPPVTNTPIKAFNKSGKEIKFNSIKEAQKYFGGRPNITRLLQTGIYCTSHRSKMLGWRFEYVNPEDAKQEHFSI